MKLKILKDRLFSITKNQILTGLIIALIIWGTWSGGYILGIYSERTSQRELRERAASEWEDLQKKNDYITRKISNEAKDFNEARQMWNDYWNDANYILKEK